MHMYAIARTYTHTHIHTYTHRDRQIDRQIDKTDTERQRERERMPPVHTIPTYLLLFLLLLPSHHLPSQAMLMLPLVSDCSHMVRIETLKALSRFVLNPRHWKLGRCGG